jgi:hypothetical protein
VEKAALELKMENTTMFGVSSSLPRTVLKVHTPAPRRRHRSARRRFRHGQCAAVIHALTAAQLYIDSKVSTLVAAAESCGSNVHYVRAAIILLKADNASLISRVLAGRMPLLAAAAEAQPLVNLITA